MPALILISGLFTALGGILFAVSYMQVSPFIGNEVALKGVAAMIIGGMGNIWGAVLGGLVIGMIEALSISFCGTLDWFTVASIMRSASSSECLSSV